MKRSNFNLYIEGTPDETNGDLREGFYELLIQKLDTKMPRIRMTNGKSQAISSFKKPITGHDPLLLIDLDAKEEIKIQFLKDEGLESRKDKVYFMIQEMEAWFLSQPSILDEFYNSNISQKIKRNASDIPNPSDELKRLTKNIDKKDSYHKVKHDVELLKKLDLSKLMSDFPDVKLLIETLSK